MEDFKNIMESSKSGFIKINGEFMQCHVTFFFIIQQKDFFL